MDNRCTIRLLIIFGVISTFIGFVMLMYGLFHTPFWNEDDHSFCDFCIDDLNQTKKNIKNTRIAGPIFLVLGLILIIAGIIMRKKSLSDHVAQGTHALSSTGGGVVGYATTGSTVTHQVNNQQPGQPAYPPSQSTYPPPPKFQGQSGAYPPPTQQYPPPAQQYPPPAQQYPPPAQQYPHPAQQYPPPAQQYPPPAQQYPPPTQQYPAQSYPGQNEAGPVPTKTGLQLIFISIYSPF